MIDLTLQKASNLLSKSRSILIIPKQLPDNKALGSAFGLAIFLESLDKNTSTLISFDAEEKFGIFQKNGFKLPSHIVPEISDTRAFVIKINTKDKPANQLKYETEDGCIKILVDSERENFSSEDISFEYTPFNYDLIVVIGISDIENLGSVYTKNKDFFDSTPTINIRNKPAPDTDNHPQKTVFNLVGQGHASKSEIVLALAESIDKKLITKDIANWLALSLSEETDNLQKPNLNTGTLHTMPTLIQYGAQKESVVLATDSKEDDKIFNAAAKILAKKEITKIKNNVFVKIHPDFFDGEINKKMLLSLAREIYLNFLKIDNVFLFLEKNKEFIVAAHIKNKVDFDKITTQLNGSAYEDCIFAKIKASSLDEAEQKIITLLNVSW